MIQKVFSCIATRCNGNEWRETNRPKRRFPPLSSLQASMVRIRENALLHSFGTSGHDRSLSILVVTAIVVIASIFRHRCCRQRCDIVVVSNLFSSTSQRATFSKLVSTHQTSRGTMRIAAFSWPSPTFRSPGIRKPVHSFRSALQLSHNLRFKVDLVCNPAPSLPSTLALSILLLRLLIL